MCWKFRAPILLLAAVLLGCSPASRGTAPTSDDFVVFRGENGLALLHQCSRATPPVGDMQWIPTAREIKAFEALLPGALSARQKSEDSDFSNVLSRWRRQYVGIVRSGRRYIYANYFPSGQLAGPTWREKPVIVCDGGPAFFGAEFDVAANRVTRLDFNGVA